MWKWAQKISHLIQSYSAKSGRPRFVCNLHLWMQFKHDWHNPFSNDTKLNILSIQIFRAIRRRRQRQPHTNSHPMHSLMMNKTDFTIECILGQLFNLWIIILSDFRQIINQVIQKKWCYELKCVSHYTRTPYIQIHMYSIHFFQFSLEKKYIKNHSLFTAFEMISEFHNLWMSLIRNGANYVMPKWLHFKKFFV